MSHAKDPCAGLEGKELRKCNKSGGVGEGSGGLSLTETEVTMTGVEAIDSVFQPVGEILDALNSATDQLKASNMTFGNAIGRENCETSAAAVARFAQEEKGELSLETPPMEIALLNPSVIDGLRNKSLELQNKIVNAAGGSAASTAKAKKIGDKMDKKIALLEKAAPKIKIPMPKLVAASGVSQRVLDVVDAVNSIMKTTLEVIQLCVTMPVRVQSIMMKATMLPAKAPRAMRKEQIDKERAAEIMGTMRGNLMALTSLPGIALKLMEQVKSFFSLLGGLTGADLPPSATEAKSITLDNGFIYYRYDNDYIGWKDGSRDGCVSPEHSKYPKILEEIREQKKIKISPNAENQEENGSDPSP